MTHDFPQTAGQPVADRMRELLARAAQDHVFEQSSQGQVLEEIRQRLQGMEWQLQEVRERELSELTGRLDVVWNQVEAIGARPPEWLRSVTEELGTVGDRVKPVAELPALWADVGVLAENVDEGLVRLHDITESTRHNTDVTLQTAGRLDELDKRIDKLQGSMEAICVRFNRLDMSLAELGHRAEQLEHSFDELGGRIDRSLADMGDRVEHGLQGLDGRLEGVSGRLDGLDGRLEGLSGKLDGSEGRFEGLGSRLDSVDDRLAGVHQRFDHLPAVMEMSEVHRRLEELSHRPYIDHSDRFDALEKWLADAVDPVLDELRDRSGSLPEMTEVRQHVTERIREVHEGVTVEVRTVHQEVLQRLATLEETMLALAEALLRPRSTAEEGL